MFWLFLEPISKIVDHVQEQGVSRRKSAVRHTFWRMSIYFKEAHNPPPAGYWALDAFLR